MNSTAETDIKAHDDLTTFAKSALFQLIRINWGIYMMSISYQYKEQQVDYPDKCIKEVLTYKD